MKRNLKKAFTLVEMLIVVIIIGILMAALLPKLKGAQERARDTARKANLSQLSTALEMYFNDKGIYPGGTCTADLKHSLVPQYLSSIPTDPQLWRITYWTKKGWCTQWSYGYTALYRNGAASGGAVLVANVEAEGRVGNFILPASPNAISFNPSAEKDMRMGRNVNVNTTDVGPGALNNNDWFKSANIAENATCKTTIVDSTKDKSYGCWGPAKLDNWAATANPYMVYVVFN